MRHEPIPAERRGTDPSSSALAAVLERARPVLDPIARSSSMGLLVLDTQLRCVEISDGASLMLARTRERVTSRRAEDALPPTIAEPLVATLRSADGLGPVQLEASYEGEGEGGTRHVVLTALPLCESELLGWIVVVSDDSDRQRLQGSLAETDRRFRALHEVSVEAFLVLRVEEQGFRILYANPAASHVLGVPAPLEGLELRAAWPGVDAVIAWDLLNAAARGEGANSAEVNRILRSGALATYRCSVVPLGPGELALRLDDVTARRRGEQALSLVAEVTRTLSSSIVREELLDRFVRAIASKMADVCAVHLRDGVGRIRCVAGAAAGAEESTTRSLAELFRNDEACSHGLGYVVRTGQSDLVRDLTPELVAEVAPDGQARDALKTLGTRSWIMVPLTVDERVEGALTLERTQPGHPYDHGDLVIAEELARRASAALENARLYEEMQRANVIKDDFLSVVSHELRTPLSTILGWSKLLADDAAPTPDRLRKGLDVIQRNARAQARLVDDILDTSRILRGRIQLDRKPIPLAVPMEEALEMVRNAARERSITLVPELDPQVRASADPIRVRQIFFHLLSNAVKFSGQGGKVVARVSAQPGYVTATVTDAGVGIDPSYLPFVFDRFRQAESSSTRKHGGLGLGLALARRLVEMHGGSIGVESAGLGLGATFTVRMPDRTTTDASFAQRTSTPPRTTKTPDLVGLHLLLVDDHDDAREMYGTVLSLRGARVTLAASAAEARARMLESRFDVLVSDIAMPHEDGVSLVRFASEHDPSMRRLAISAYTRNEDAERALAAGFERYLTKPVDTHELASTVAELATTRASLA